jgi:hypothetical protein
MARRAGSVTDGFVTACLVFPCPDLYELFKALDSLKTPASVTARTPRRSR